MILILSPNASINKEHLFNAVHNNWNGYGLILKDGNGHTQCLKKYDEKAIDPEEVWKLLEDNKDIERYLHVRYTTKGASNESNVQPFQVYNSSKRQIWFMHNGTLPSFGSYTTGQGKSDTLEFCEKVLAPSLLKWVGDNGKADYLDKEYYNLVVEKQWVSHSKGLFVSNDLGYLRIGMGWTEYKHPDDTSNGVVWVSNTNYFEKLTRGPMFQRIEAEKKAQQEKERKTEVTLYRPFQGQGDTTLKEWSTGSSRSQKVIKAVVDAIDTWDLDDPKLVAKMRFVAYDEWLSVIEDQGEFVIAALIEQMSEKVYDLTMKNSHLRIKHDKASKIIEELQSERIANAA